MKLFHFLQVQELHGFQAPYQIFVDWSARIGEPNSHSVSSDLHIPIIYPRCHVSLLSLAFISFRITVISSSSGHSKLALEFERSECE
jgi:hypothetical protein